MSAEFEEALETGVNPGNHGYKVDCVMVVWVGLRL